MKKGTKFTDEHREKISNSLKGRKLTEEHRKNMSEAKKGKPSNCAKSVKIIYLNKEYNFASMTAAEKFFQETFGIKIFYWFLFFFLFLTSGHCISPFPYFLLCKTAYIFLKDTSALLIIFKHSPARTCRREKYCVSLYRIFIAYVNRLFQTIA